ncbi:UDP-glucose 4-epimerase [Pirellula sp. SH-Sr6A]|uniref:NAD-dependent epimerase n=1 Tax=Pirellula sp. SH-Sr6A TaxID=1632865 RepID=UPI00078C8FE9|nr:NAD-dependent epimerase [Pirellula sp. SH-Sr6A]AMV32272.1 UDP-glucose 4-epimerase [Pirellula sp. SH-Sr6A]
MSRTILVTGAAGFIGFHTCLQLLHAGFSVVGLDNLNDYYDVRLKEARLKELEKQPAFRFVRSALEDRSAIEKVFAQVSFHRVIHLGAQAGVRYSLTNPYSYIDSNLQGTMTILEGCRHHGIEHLVYASSSSVYGKNVRQPFSVDDSVDHPISLYAATKKANELMAHTYSHLYRLPTTGLRFFTVYGPWGRPDMALYKFTDAIFQGRPIDVYNHGKMCRDFTYIDDIVTAIVRVMDCIPTPDPTWSPESPTPGSSDAPYRVYNIGNHQPTELLRFIEVLEDAIGKKAVMNLLPMQPGDVPSTFADVEALQQAVGFAPSTPIEEGIRRFVAWYREYHRV